MKMYIWSIILIIVGCYIVFASLFQNERKHNGSHKKGVVKYECGLRQNNSEGIADDSKKLRNAELVNAKNIEHPGKRGRTDDD